MVASEARPFATTGGLSEVLGSLPQALAGLGHRVTVIVPKYRVSSIPRAGTGTPGPRRAGPAGHGETILELGRRHDRVRFHEVPLGERVDAVLVDVPDLFDRPGLYGTAEGDYPDNAYRFAAFSRAALEYVRMRRERPSVIHTHDWQAGLVPAYQKMLFSNDPIVGGVPAVFTIHNLAFQGLFPAGTIDDIGLPWDVFHVQAMEFWGQISFLKSGINFSERITTVSPTYAREILTPDQGFGFDGVLSRRARSLVGILNGIDTATWDPAADRFLPAPYDADNPAGKQEAKRALLQTLGLPAEDDGLMRPVIGMVSRLTDQKGFDLVAGAADDLLQMDATWVLLGSGERRYEQMWTDLAARHPDRVSATIGFDDRLEHLIEGGADAFLMPSRFEPCGLNQLNSLRYGTLPIVRATGGLEDTVRDADEPGGNGFKFSDPTPGALTAAVRRALELYRSPEHWRRLQQAAMRGDYSWDASAREYVKVYSATS
jgi:starch synthase